MHHGGADATVIESLIRAVSIGDASSILTTTAESLRSNSVVFAAERSRLEGRRVLLKELHDEMAVG